MGLGSRRPEGRVLIATPEERGVHVYEEGKSGVLQRGRPDETREDPKQSTKIRN